MLAEAKQQKVGLQTFVYLLSHVCGIWVQNLDLVVFHFLFGMTQYSKMLTEERGVGIFNYF